MGKEDIVKKYGKIIHEHELLNMRVTFDYLHNIKVETDSKFNHLIQSLQN